jgi:hypothetical protein
MTLEKSRKLRQVEVIFTDDKVHDTCHCVYRTSVEEDGVEIASSNERQTSTLADIKTLLDESEVYVHPEI